MEQWKIGNLSPNSYYKLRLSARNEYGNSEFSPVLTFCPGASPMQLQSSIINNGQVTTLMNSHIHHYNQQPHGSMPPRHLHQFTPQSHPQKTHIIVQKPSPPTVLSVSARAVRLSWNITSDFYTVIVSF